MLSNTEKILNNKLLDSQNNLDNYMRDTELQINQLENSLKKASQEVQNLSIKLASEKEERDELKAVTTQKIAEYEQKVGVKCPIVYFIS